MSTEDEADEADQRAREDEDALIIAALVWELITGNPSDDRYRVLEAMSYHAVSAFGEGLPREMIGDGRDNPAAFEPLLRHPAAGPLLAYVVNALQRFDFGGRDNPKAKADLRAALSDAFGLTGKQGERPMPMEHRMGIATRYQAELHIAMRELKRSGSPDGAVTQRKAERAAFRTVYRLMHGADYDSAHEADKQRMKVLKRIVKATPTFIEFGVEKTSSD